MKLNEILPEIESGMKSIEDLRGKPLHEMANNCSGHDPIDFNVSVDFKQIIKNKGLFGFVNSWTIIFTNSCNDTVYKFAGEGIEVTELYCMTPSVDPEVIELVERIIEARFANKPIYFGNQLGVKEK